MSTRKYSTFTDAIHVSTQTEILENNGGCRLLLDYLACHLYKSIFHFTIQIITVISSLDTFSFVWVQNIIYILTHGRQMRSGSYIIHPIFHFQIILNKVDAKSRKKHLIQSNKLVFSNRYTDTKWTDTEHTTTFQQALPVKIQKYEWQKKENYKVLF